MLNMREQLAAEARAPRRRRVMLYLNNQLYENLRLGFEAMKEDGLVPQKGEFNDYRAVVLNWMVMRAAEDLP